MIQKLRNVGFASLAGLPGFAFAAPDVSDVVTEIAATSAPITAIGSAVLLVIVGIKVFKWVQRVL